MSKLIWMSDLHFAAEGSIMGIEPCARLRAAVDLINTQYGDAEKCVISGDMVNRGTARDYRAVRVELDRLAMPYVPMVGNHDSRTEFSAALEVALDSNGFAQSAFSVSGVWILCLDTLTPGEDYGSYCTTRLAWLSAQLALHPNAPTFVFMHHPPLILGLPMQDQDRLLEADGLLDVLSAAPQVKHLFIGHVHRPIVGTVRGIPFATMRSILMQAPPPKPDWNWENFEPAKEASAIGVIDFTGDDMVMQFVDVPS